MPDQNTFENKNAMETFNRSRNPPPTNIIANTNPIPKEVVEAAFRKIDELEEKLESQSQIDPEAAGILESMPGNRPTVNSRPLETAAEVDLRRADEELKAVQDRVTKDNYFMPTFSEAFMTLSFDRKLAVLGFTRDSIAVITDNLVLHGFYEKTISIRGKLNVTLRSRETEIYIQALEEFVSNGGGNRMKMMETMSLYNCAGTVLKYGATIFKPLSEIAPNERAAYLRKKIDYIYSMAGAVYNILSIESVKFDMLLTVATSQEALDNF